MLSTTAMTLAAQDSEPLAGESFRIDRESARPLHAQVDSFLRELIQRPEFADGTLLPNEVDLAKRLGVSRSTIRAGMQRLTFEGLVERRAGHGSRVVRPTLHSGLSEWHSLTGEMSQYGIEIQNFEVTKMMEEADSEVASALGIEEGTKVLQVRRVRGWSGERVVLTVSYLAPRLGLTPEIDAKGSLYSVIREIGGATPVRSVEEITAHTASEALAQSLAIEEGAPVLYRRRVTLDAADRPIEFNINWYRSDIHALRMDLKKG